MNRGHVVIVGTGLCLALSACHAKVPGQRLRVTLKGDKASAAVVVVEQALRTLAGVGAAGSLRSVGCVDDAIVALSMPAQKDVEATTAIKEAIRMTSTPGHVSVEVSAVNDAVVVFAVRAPDAVSARTFVDAQLIAPIAQVPGVVDVQVLGGRQERQVRVDLEKMMALDVSLPEVAQAAGGGSSLLATIVRDGGVAPVLSSEKGVGMPPSAAAVMLIDIASIGVASAGEPLRRDGAVEVRVYGNPSARGAVIAAALGVQRPGGIEVSPLDDDSVEGVDVLVFAATAASVAEVHALLLDVPGVRLPDLPQRVRVTIDEERARQLGVRASDVAQVKAIAAGDGFVLIRNTENVVLRLDRAVSVELMGQLVVSRTAAGPVRLLDVARIESVSGREDRLDGQPVQRLHVVFDVGVRKVALAALDQRLRSLAGVRAIVERDDVGAGVCP